MFTLRLHPEWKKNVPSNQQNVNLHKNTKKKKKKKFNEHKISEAHIVVNIHLLQVWSALFVHPLHNEIKLNVTYVYIRYIINASKSHQNRTL
jgi:hypothetical protein